MRRTIDGCSRPLAWMLAALAVVSIVGCASQRVAVAPLAQEFESYRRDARALQPSDAARDALESGEAKSGEAAALRLKKKDAAAAALYRVALADARAAIAAANTQDAESGAEDCRRNLDGVRQQWERSLRQLEQTEKISGRRADTVARSAPYNAPAPPELPATAWESAAPPAGTESELKTRYDAWRAAAASRTLATADLDTRLGEALALAGDPKAKPEARDRNLYVAGRVLQELESRVRIDDARSACAEANRGAAAYSQANDTALRAMLDLERDLRDDLRAELERSRAEAQSRQEEMYDALHKLEGKLLSITQDARGTIVSLADILFDFDKATLKRDVEFGLVKVATILNQFPEMRIQVEGHTDNVGKADYNLELSKRRATAVHDFLADQEVAPERMTVEGYGMTRPIADNDTEAGRAKNRRVDLVIQESQ
ncbi:MAG: OmpA family protein [Candidatus Eisenbacteria bacterium]